MLVRDHEHARAALQDVGQLGRVQQALDGAVDDERRLRERAHHRAEALERVAGAGRAHRRRRREPRGRARRRGRAARRAGASASSASSTLTGRDWVSDRIATASPGRDVAAAEDLGEAVDPLPFDSLAQHRSGLPSGHGSRTGLRPAALARDVLDRQSDPPGQDTPCPRRKKCTRRDSALMPVVEKKPLSPGNEQPGRPDTPSTAPDLDSFADFDPDAAREAAAAVRPQERRGEAARPAADHGRLPGRGGGRGPAARSCTTSTSARNDPTLGRSSRAGSPGSRKRSAGTGASARSTTTSRSSWWTTAAAARAFRPTC